MRNRKIFRLLLTAVLALAVLAGCAGEQEPVQTEIYQTIPAMVGTEPPTEPPVRISMGAYELSYSGALKDVLRWTEVTEGSGGLAFTVMIREKEYPVFTMHYHSDQGDMVTVLKDGSGAQVPVAFQMAEIPEELGEEDAMTFYAAQEAVNEVVASLTLK